MAKLILLNKCSGDKKKNKRTTPKQYCENFCQHQGRQSIEILMYVTRIFIDCCLPWGSTEERSRWSDNSDAFYFPLEMLPCSCFHLSSAVFNILTFSSKAIREMGGYPCSTEQGFLWHWHQPLLEGSHHTVKRAKLWQTQRDEFLCKYPFLAPYIGKYESRLEAHTLSSRCLHSRHRKTILVRSKQAVYLGNRSGARKKKWLMNLT